MPQASIWRKPLSPILGVVTLLATGCISTGTYQSARTLETGKMEFNIVPNVGSMTTPFEGAAATVPNLQMAIRYGINNNADFGVRLGMDGLNFETKFQIVRTPQLAVALAPGLGGIGFGVGGVGAGFVTYNLPIIVGFMLSPTFEFTLTPKFSGVTLMGASSEGSASGTLLIPAVGIGADIALSPGLRLHPELSVGSAFGTASASTGESASDAFGPRFNLGMGISMGGNLAK